MSQAFGRMNLSLGKNLNIVNKHIQNLLDGNSSDEQDEPKLESLSQILSVIQIQLKQSFLTQMKKKTLLQAPSGPTDISGDGISAPDPTGTVGTVGNKNEEAVEWRIKLNNSCKYSKEPGLESAKSLKAI